MIFVANTIFEILYGALYRFNIQDEKNKKRYVFMCFFLMFLLQALRGINVGTDTQMYVSVYEGFQTRSYDEYRFTHFEPGFQLMYIILQGIGCSSQIMLALMSCIIIFGFARFILQNSSNIVMSTVLFSTILFPNSNNVMRQYVAYAIAINAFPLIEKHKYVKAMLLVLLGSTIHVSAILMVVPLVFEIFKNWKLIFQILIIVSAFAFVFGEQIINIVLPFIGKQYYLQSIFVVQRLFRMTTLECFSILAVLVLLGNRFQDKTDRKRNRIMVCIAATNCIFGVLYLKIEIMSRLIEALNSFALISLPAVTYKSRSRYMPVVRMLIYCISILLLVNFVFNSGAGIEQYNFFWENIK